MIKSELVQIVASRNLNLYLKDVEKVVDAVFDEITNALCDGRRVELRNFGAFSVKHRTSHVARDPRTGEALDVKEKWVPFFRPGKGIRDRLNRQF